MEWITSRIKEPSSWAAAGVAVIGVAVVSSQYWLVVAAIVVAVVAFVLKEKGIL